MTDFVACYERGIKVIAPLVHPLQHQPLKDFLSSLSDLAAPQAECKLENTEGNRDQARCCRANMSNHGQLSGGSGAERYGAIGPQGNRSNEQTSMAALTRRQSDYSFSTIWVSHLLPAITVHQVLPPSSLPHTLLDATPTPPRPSPLPTSFGPLQEV